MPGGGKKLSFLIWASDIPSAKIHVVTCNNKIFAENMTGSNIYLHRETAESVAQQWQRTAMAEAGKMWNKGQPVRKYDAHSFYLVHESLFEEILKEFSKE